MARANRQTPSLFGEEVEPPAEVTPAPLGLYAKVALNRPVPTEFTYDVPERFRERIAVGSRVAVFFGRRRQVGVVVALDERTDVARGKLKALSELLDDEPLVREELLDLTRWIAERYASSWGEALAAILPAALKRESQSKRVLVVRAAADVGKEQLQELEENFPKQHRLLRTLLDLEGRIELRDVLRNLNLSDSPARTLEKRGWIVIEKVAAEVDGLDSARPSDRVRPEHLSPHQEAALGALEGALQDGEYRGFLLEGVTGSGKTEVYLRCIETALAHGKSAIVLVPEISLTPQTVGWFRSRFGEVAVLHSRMTDAQRLVMWMRLQKGEVRVVVGARSAIFAPLSELGVVVVDEEHEPSFKQGSVPRYHARDVALERCRRSKAVCILGSATPSLESWHAAASGELTTLSLPERVGGGTFPSMHVVDMRLERERGKGPPLFSRLLRTFLKETVADGEQAIFFVNRRGFIPVLWCRGCEETIRCDQCSMAMTFHKRIAKLVCHGCCEERAVPAACPACTRPGLTFLGFGSEGVERTLRETWPELRVRRMDSDTMRRREDYEEALSAFGRGEIDVLVGTQMIAKGLDFPRVTLVGILAPDQSLSLPDFRASERTFQLIAQVAGRAGRASLPGRIVIQTSVPDHPTLKLAAKGDFRAFAEHELRDRFALGYPPATRLVRILLEGPDEKLVQATGAELHERLVAALRTTTLELRGPEVAPISLLRKRFRYEIIVVSPPDDPGLPHAVATARDFAAKQNRVRVGVDVDPMSLL